MGQVKQAGDDEIEQRALFSCDSPISPDEAFEILSAAGIDEIAWSDPLNIKYSQWQYINLK